jgi:hypothetical protein
MSHIYAGLTLTLGQGSCSSHDYFESGQFPQLNLGRHGAGRAHNRDMAREHRYPARRNVAAALRRVLDRIRNWGRRSPPPAGVREPRRPKPSLPAAAVALKEPTVRTTRWIRLVNRRSDGQT